MTQARRFHGPGQGGRTGLRVAQDIDSLSGFFEAGRNAIRSVANHDDTTDSDDDDDYEDDDDGNEEASVTTGASGRWPERGNTSIPSSSAARQSIGTSRLSGLGSSSMDIENSYAPSPNRTPARRPTSSPQATPDDSILDYGPDAEADGWADGDDSRRAGPSARPSFALSTPGAGRQRASDVSRSHLDSPQRSSRLSTLDATRPGDDSIPMDLAGDDDYPELPFAPSPNRGASTSYLAPQDEDGLAEGVYEDEHMAEEGKEEESQPAAQPNESSPKKRGRPRKNGKQRGESGSSRQPRLPSELGGDRIIERIASSRGKAGTVMDGDVRRSTRHRIAPLDWWRGERAVYGRPSSSSRHSDDREGQNPDDTVDADAFEDSPVKSYGVPVLKSVIRVARAPGEGTFAGMRITKKSSGNGRVKGKRRKRAKGETPEDGEEVEIELDPEAPSRHPEDGWDDNTEAHGVVWDVEQQAEVRRRVVCPITQLRTTQAANSTFAFEKIFSVDDYMAGGILEIAPDGEKPLKPTKDNNYVFVVLEGAIDVQIYRTYYRLAPGGTFTVPKGNTYAVRNISRRTARIFFAQSRVPQKTTPDSSVRGTSAAASTNNRSASQSQDTPVPTSQGRSKTHTRADETVDVPDESQEGIASKNGKSKGRGRPKKTAAAAPADDSITPHVNGHGDDSTAQDTSTSSVTPLKRKRGRPKKNP